VVTPTPKSTSWRQLSVGTPEHFRWLRWLVAALLVLNLLDAIFTLLWVTSGLATEANPMMAELLRSQPVLFMLGKLALVGGGSYLLWRRRRRPLAVVAIFIAFLCYYLILLRHLDYLGMLLAQL